MNLQEIKFGEKKPAANLFDGLARQVAQQLKDDQTARNAGNKSTQIRGFYDEIVSWQQRIGSEQEKFEQYEAFLRMMNAKVAYALGRKANGTPLVSKFFQDWFSHCLAQTNSPEALGHFRLHFEAMLGFRKALGD